MDNETTVTKPAAEQAATAERTRSGCCYRPNVDILEQPTSCWCWPTCRATRATRST